MMQRKTRSILMAAAAVATLAVASVSVAVAHANGYAGVGGRHGSAGFNETDGQLTGTFVTATVDVASATFTSIDLKDANSTHPLVESVTLATPDGATVTASSGGDKRCARGYVLDDGAGDRLGLEDSPRAGFLATSANGTTLTIVLPAGVAITPHDAVDAWSPAGATVDYGNGQKANLVLKNATLSVDGQTLTVTLDAGGAAAYGIVPGEGWGFGFGHHGPGMPGPGFGGPHGGMHGTGGPRGHR